MVKVLAALGSYGWEALSCKGKRLQHHQFPETLGPREFKIPRSPSETLTSKGQLSPVPHPQELLCVLHTPSLSWRLFELSRP